MRGRSYTPSPPRGYSRRGRSPSPRGRYGGRSRDLPTSLLVRNLRHDCRQDDLRRPFGQFGPLKDIYLPKDYHTGQPRGFGFVQFVDPQDAAEAKYHMDGQILLGREVTVVFAEENRKKPSDMRARERGSRGNYRDRRRSPPRYSRSPPPRLAGSRSHSRDYYSPPKRRNYSRSVSPQERRYSRDRSYSRSPPYNGSRSPSRSPARGPSGARSPSHSRSRSRSPKRSLSRSPNRYPDEPNGSRSPSP
ncbi:serine/arginine-rich SC35-like splicing factor SCL33 isoform X2 [Cannabis sativa]|uniref:serine/arginine-rich SC35-like splicing factor SCL33 isoform X2 n=1 Tax=Cannabis sativa TaxID=3483 RepID=UPI0011DFD932|nr:serine/arginine-rich SC35-like splicing factor SCL33 isoform X2 [Cannabis sativa]